MSTDAQLETAIQGNKRDNKAISKQPSYLDNEIVSTPRPLSNDPTFQSMIEDINRNSTSVENYRYEYETTAPSATMFNSVAEATKLPHTRNSKTSNITREINVSPTILNEIINFLENSNLVPNSRETGSSASVSTHATAPSGISISGQAQNRLSNDPSLDKLKLALESLQCLKNGHGNV